MLEQVQIKRHASVQRKKKGLKHFTRNLSSHRPLTFSTPIIQTSFRIIVSAGRNHYPPSVKFTRFPPSSTKHDKRNKIGLSTPSVVRIAPFQQETSSDSRRRTSTTFPLSSLLRNFLDRYCIIIGESVARSSSSPSRAGRGWKRCRSIRSSQLWQKASAETCTISCKERNRGQRGNPVSIAPVTNVVKDRYESSLASNTKSGEGGRGRGNSAANFLTAPIFCERALDLP